jgi:hypothetical protein
MILYVFTVSNNNGIYAAYATMSISRYLNIWRSTHADQIVLQQSFKFVVFEEFPATFGPFDWVGSFNCFSRKKRRSKQLLVPHFFWNLAMN